MALAFLVVAYCSTFGDGCRTLGRGYREGEPSFRRGHTEKYLSRSKRTDKLCHRPRGKNSQCQAVSVETTVPCRSVGRKPESRQNHTQRISHHLGRQESPLGDATAGKQASLRCVDA